MSDDSYLPRHLSTETQEYESTLLSSINNPNQAASQRKRRAPVKRVSSKRAYLSELNAAHGLPKDLSERYSKWFYHNIKSRRLPHNGGQLATTSPDHQVGRMDINLGTNQFKLLSQELEQRDCEPFGVIKTCFVSLSEELIEDNLAVSFVLDSRSTLVDRRPALKKLKNINLIRSRQALARSRPDSLIKPEEDCDDSSQEGEED